MTKLEVLEKCTKCNFATCRPIDNLSTFDEQNSGKFVVRCKCHWGRDYPMPIYGDNQIKLVKQWNKKLKELNDG